MTSILQLVFRSFLLLSFPLYLFAQNFHVSAPQINYGISSGKTADHRIGTFSVDPEIYLLGPGDAFEIRSSKMPWVQYYGTVNESSVLYIPELGTFNVDKKSLGTAKAEIAQLILKQNMAGDEIDILLASPKEVEVVVTGESVKSGSFRLSGTMRVLDAIKTALKDSVLLFRDINMRDVSVTVQGKTTHLDLAGFIAHGKGTENPYLYPGAIISLSPPTKWITVSGAVSSAFPEVMPLRSGEAYRDVFMLYKLTDDADTANILLYREGYSPKKYTVSEIASVLVENSDYVIVGSLLPRKQPASVFITGEVKNPGAYPLESGVRVARGVVTIAGGITDRGDSNRIYIIRKDPLGSVAHRLQQETGSIKNDNLMYKVMLSGDYRIIPLRGVSNELLEDGDEIVVPEISNTVHLGGCINKPGAYPFVKDKSVSYYVKMAGGWTKNADRKNWKIVTAYDEHWIVKTTPVEAGDLIFVPERSKEDKLRTVDILIRTIYYVGLTITAFLTLRDKIILLNDD